MSKYIYNLGVSLERALAGVPNSPAAQVAGYWANRDFWLDEFDHLLSVVNGYGTRLQRMNDAYDRYAGSHKVRETWDEFGRVQQRPKDTTAQSLRRDYASDARTAMKTLADRAMDLGIASEDEYNRFVGRLRISGR